MAEQEIRLRVALEGVDHALQNEILKTSDALNTLKGSFANVKPDNSKYAQYASQIQATEKYLTSLSVSQGQVSQSLQESTVSTDKAHGVITNLNNAILQAPQGVSAFTGSLAPLIGSFFELVSATGSTRGAFNAVFSLLSGPTGIGLAISAVIALATVFGDKIVASFGIATEAAKKFKKTINQQRIGEALSFDTDTSKYQDKIQEALSGQKKTVSYSDVAKQSAQLESLTKSVETDITKFAQRADTKWQEAGDTIRRAAVQALNAADQAKDPKARKKAIQGVYDSLIQSNGEYRGVINNDEFSTLVKNMSVQSKSAEALKTVRAGYDASLAGETNITDEGLRSVDEEHDKNAERYELEAETAKQVILSKNLSQAEEAVALKKVENRLSEQLLQNEIDRLSEYEKLNVFDSEKKSALQTQLNAMRKINKQELAGLENAKVESEIANQKELLDLKYQTKKLELEGTKTDRAEGELQKKQKLFLLEQDYQRQKLLFQLELNETKLLSAAISDQEREKLQAQNDLLLEQIELLEKKKSPEDEAKEKKEERKKTLKERLTDYEEKRQNRDEERPLDEKNFFGEYDEDRLELARGEAVTKAEAAAESGDTKKFGEALAEVQEIDGIFQNIADERATAIADNLRSGFDGITNAVGDELGQSLFRGGSIASARIGSALGSAFKSAASNLVSELVSSGIMSLISMIGGGGPVGLIGGIAGMFAGGGSVRAGEPVIVGDAPGGRLTPYSELFVPKTDGFIASNRDMNKLLSNATPARQSTTVVDMSEVVTELRQSRTENRKLNRQLSLTDSAGKTIAEQTNKANAITKALRAGG